MKKRHLATIAATNNRPNLALTFSHQTSIANNHDLTPLAALHSPLSIMQPPHHLPVRAWSITALRDRATPRDRHRPLALSVTDIASCRNSLHVVVSFCTANPSYRKKKEVKVEKGWQIRKKEGLFIYLFFPLVWSHKVIREVGRPIPSWGAYILPYTVALLPMTLAFNKEVFSF